MNVGLVLSGGGARGIAHLGVVQALHERDVKFSVISGTSMGALLGSLLAQGYAPREVLRIVSSSSFFKSLRPGFWGNGLLRIERMAEVLLHFLPDNSFGALEIPLSVAATDINAGEIVYFSEGELIAPVLASCCIPGIFRPYSYQGKVFVDGGVLDNFPVSPAQKFADFIIGVHCNPFALQQPVRTTREVLARSFILAAHSKTKDKFNLCQLLVEPPGLSRYTLYDFWKAREIFDVGYEYANRYLTIHPSVLGENARG